MKKTISIEAAIQISVILQIWRVIDLIATSNMRDARVDCTCSIEDCCYRKMIFTFNRDLGDGIDDFNPLELAVANIGNISPLR